jgi:hypothetical protein
MHHWRPRAVHVMLTKYSQLGMGIDCLRRVDRAPATILPLVQLSAGTTKPTMEVFQANRWS